MEDFLNIFATTVIASGGEGGHSASLSDWLSRIINFAVLAGIFYWVIFKLKGGVVKSKAKDLFTNRSEGIAKAINDAEQAKETARKGLETILGKLKEKDKEIEGILDAAGTNGEKERISLIEEGERIGQGLVLHARENIEQELRKAKESLREEAVNIALELAEGRIKENIKKEDQDQILREYLKKLGDNN